MGVLIGIIGVLACACAGFAYLWREAEKDTLAMRDAWIAERRCYCITCGACVSSPTPAEGGG